MTGEEKKEGAGYRSWPAYRPCTASAPHYDRGCPFRSPGIPLCYFSDHPGRTGDPERPG